MPKVSGSIWVSAFQGFHGKPLFCAIEMGLDTIRSEFEEALLCGRCLEYGAIKQWVLETIKSRGRGQTSLYGKLGNATPSDE